MGSGRIVWVTVSPPVCNEATILGTVPVWWEASCTRPPVAPATPGTLAISATASAGKLTSVAERKKSRVNWSPGFPSLERSVTTFWFSASSAC
jgi:hypothetical protein